MSGKEVLKKLTSRKFIAMLLGVALGCAMAFGVEGDEISTIAGSVTSIVSLVYYMFTEGKIDRAALSETTESVKKDEEQDSLLEDLFGP